MTIYFLNATLTTLNLFVVILMTYLKTTKSTFVITKKLIKNELKLVIPPLCNRFFFFFFNFFFLF